MTPLISTELFKQNMLKNIPLQQACKAYHELTGDMDKTYAFVTKLLGEGMLLEAELSEAHWVETAKRMPFEFNRPKKKDPLL